MIFNEILTFFYNVAIWIINFLPNADSTIVTEITDQLANFKSYLIVANWLFPVNLALTLLQDVIAIEFTIFLWHILRIVGGIMFLVRFL